MRKSTLLFLLPAALFGQYQYYNSGQQNDPSQWTTNGSAFTSTNGGSQISNQPVPAPSSYYEVKITLNIKASGGTFIAYTHATTDALSGPTTAGTFYSFELQDVVVNGSSCSGTFVVYKRIAGAVSILASSPEPCKDGMSIRIAQGGGLFIHSDLGTAYWIGDSSIATGLPGFGARDMNTAAGNGFANVQLGAYEFTPPVPVAQSAIASSVSANQVDLQWPNFNDGSTGSGLCMYVVFRDSNYMGAISTPTFSDHATAPNTAYQYTIYGYDYHGNVASTQPIPIHTPATGGIDPRRTGVRANGAYWGGMGEQIDLFSGNLNFTLPLIRAQGRAGWGVTFALNYNSANFRKENTVGSAATWKMGRDSGYGFGWKFLAGSITPYYSNWLAVDHYLFTDSTGAEYRLNQQSNGIWYSKESIYVRFDPSKNQLYFPDGSFWEFGALSAGIEEDAGTLYPTKMQDSNANQIILTYQQGTYALDPQSSSRITFIEDARALQCNSNTLCTYWLNYSSGATPHLTDINSISAVGVYYTFTMTSGVALNSPFASDSSTFGTTSRLDTLTSAYGLQHNMTYNGNNSGELTKVTFPYGGSLAWTFRDFTFSDSRVIRDMQYRVLNDGTNGNKQYSFYHDDTHDYNTSNHWVTAVVDETSTAYKQWWFDNTSGLQTHLYEYGYTLVNGNWTAVTQYRSTDLYWTTDSDGNPYINNSYNTIDPGLSSQKIARTDQTRDNYGNLTEMKVYDYTSQTTPVRTYNNTFRTDAVYTSRYIRNLLSTSSVTPVGGSAIPLATNYYDQDGACPATGSTTPPDSAHEFDSTYNGNGASYRGNPCISSTISSYRKFGYDRAGTVVLTQDALGHTVTSTTDASRNYAVPSAITTGNLTSNMTWNGAFQPTGATNPNGATTSLAYDAYARPTGGTSPYGATTTIAYSNSPPTKTVTVNTRWTKTTMDGFGRPVKTETGYNTVNGTIITPTTVSSTETEYAPCGCTPVGKVKRVSQTHAPNATVYWTTYTYDALGRTTAVSQPNNLGQTTYAYSGNTVTVTDAAQKWKTFTTDAMGNLTLVTEPRPSTSLTDLTYYTYNAFNQLRTVSMTRPTFPANNTNVTQTRTFEYDSAQRVHSVTNPENGTTSYTYNADNTLNTKTDAKGQTLTYVYDPTLGRLLQVKNGATVLRTFTYDSNGWGQYLSGRVARVDYGDGKWSELYSYHPAGGRTAKRLSYTYGSGQNSTTQNLDAYWTYNNEGQVTSVKYPDTTTLDSFARPVTVTGDTYTYTFDAMGRPKDLTTTPGDGSAAYLHVQNVTYGVAGELSGISYLGGSGFISESRTYNARMQLTSINASGIASIGYSYYDVPANTPADTAKNNGKVGQMTSTIAGSTEVVNYKYDSLNRLIAAYTNDTSSAGWGRAWDYL